jgi:hypothetical protein
MESIMIWAALILGIVNALLPIAKRLALKTQTKSDDKVVEFFEEALLLAKNLQAEKKALDGAKKKSA